MDIDEVYKTRGGRKVKCVKANPGDTFICVDVKTKNHIIYTEDGKVQGSIDPQDPMELEGVASQVDESEA